MFQCKKFRNFILHGSINYPKYGIKLANVNKGSLDNKSVVQSCLTANVYGD